jgi:hypothetical protein
VAVGPPSGETDFVLAAYVVALDVPAALWRGKDVHFGRVWTASLLLLAPGFLGSLPLVYEMFTAR